MNIHNIYSFFQKLGNFREKRFDLFLNKIHPTKNDVILDVGGYPNNWINKEHLVKKIICLNLIKKDSKISNVDSVIGDARKLSYNDNQFNIVYSNSVIEHVGRYEDQKKFASELLRVGQKIFIQTPAVGFFFEPHFIAPFIHWFPLSIRRYLIYLTPWFWITKPKIEEINHMIESTRLLSKKELKRLFPNCEIHNEKFLFLTKSFMIIKK